MDKSPIDLASNLLVPAVYGGDGEINEVGDPNDGLAASAHALTQFIHLHAVWGNGPRAAGSARSGSTPGASTLAASRWDGVDWACRQHATGPPSRLTDARRPVLTRRRRSAPLSITHVLDTTPIPWSGRRG